jgi:hypothetical protein
MTLVTGDGNGEGEAMGENIHCIPDANHGVCSPSHESGPNFKTCDELQTS